MKSVNKKILIILTIIIGFMLLQCVSIKINSVNAASIKISTSKRTLYVGYGCKLRISGTNKKIKWSSSNTKIAKVTQAGNVTAKKAGTVTITAKVSGKKYKCKITVKDYAKMVMTDRRNFEFYGKTTGVKYYTSNKKIATIDKKGNLITKKAGKVTITAKVSGKKYKMTLKVVDTGWINYNKKRYYYLDGKKLKGWHYIDGYKYYFSKGKGILDEDVTDRIGKKSSYYITVNRTTCVVTIYAANKNNDYVIPVKAMTCSVGKSKTPTPKGTYKTIEKHRWGLLMGPSYGQYCTRIVDGVLFHSVAGYNKTSYNLSAYDYNKLGEPASHGCVRLCVRDAKWIYDNCKIGTTVKIMDSSTDIFSKPATIKIKSSQHYDPTDPNIKKK